MTVNSTTNRVSYNGNNTANPLAVAFPFQAQADLLVIETVIATGVQTMKVLNTDYSISGSTDPNGFYPNGGSVVPAGSIAATLRWTIIRNPTLTQLVQHVDNDPVPAASLDNPLDKLTMIAQRLTDRADRSLSFADGDIVTASGVLPSVVGKAGKVLAVNDDEDGFTFENPDAETASAAAAQAVAAAATAGSDLWSRPVIAAQNTPAVSPVEGDRYLVTSVASGAWAGKETQVAQWVAATSIWKFSGVPSNGQMLQVAGTEHRYISSTWQSFEAHSGSGASRITAVMGTVGIGGNPNQWNYAPEGPYALDVVVDSANPTNGFVISNFGYVGTFHSHFARGTAASPTMALSGDTICDFGFRAYNSADNAFGGSSIALLGVIEENATMRYPAARFVIQTCKTGVGRETNTAFNSNGSMSPNRIGIGTSAPVQDIEVRVDRNGSTMTLLRNAAADAGAEAEFRASNGSYDMQMLMGGAAFTPSGMKSDSRGCVIANGTGGMAMGTTSNTAYTRWTNNTLRETLSNAGAFRWHAYGAGTLTTDGSGNITATSDPRLKTKIRGYKGGLDAVLALKPVTYRWKKSSKLDTSRDYVGFLATDDFSVDGAVSKGPDGFNTLSDRAIIAALVNAVKELSAKVEKLEAAK